MDQKFWDSLTRQFFERTKWKNTERDRKDKVDVVQKREKMMEKSGEQRPVSDSDLNCK